MKSFIKLAVAVIAVLAVIFTGANIILHNENKGDAGRPYRVEAERIAARIENREPYSLNDYSYIKNVEIQENGFQGVDSVLRQTFSDIQVILVERSMSKSM